MTSRRVIDILSYADMAGEECLHQVLGDFACPLNEEEEKFLKYGGMECCECGCCSFICPARRPLTQEISSMRKVLLAKRKKK